MLRWGRPSHLELGCCRPNRRHASAGFTLIELLAIVVLVFCVLQGVNFGRQMVGSWYGKLLGGFAGFLLFFLGLFAWATLMDLWTGRGLPKCRNGCCRGPGNFRGDGDYDIGRIAEEHVWVCRCGGRYRRHGRRFVIVNDDGVETPYLVWRPFRGWFPDASERTEVR